MRFHATTPLSCSRPRHTASPISKSTRRTKKSTTSHRGSKQQLTQRYIYIYIRVYLYIHVYSGVVVHLVVHAHVKRFVLCTGRDMQREVRLLSRRRRWVDTGAVYAGENRPFSLWYGAKTGEARWEKAAILFRKADCQASAKGKA